MMCELTNKLVKIREENSEKFLPEDSVVEQLEQQLAAAKAELDGLASRTKAAEAMSAHLEKVCKEYYNQLEQAESKLADAMDALAMRGAEIVRLSEGKEQAEAELTELKEYQSFCPECGSKNIFSPINRTETGHLACKDCGQEFFTTVIYADCIAEKLSKLKLTEQRAEQAEAQCAAMQTAINRYVLGNIELLDALKAALEEKA